MNIKNIFDNLIHVLQLKFQKIIVIYFKEI